MKEAESSDAATEPTVDFKGRNFITRADLAKHSGKDDAWMTIDGKVYDVSKYLEDHPVGLMPPTQPAPSAPPGAKGPCRSYAPWGAA
eukprot:Transcript_32482.p3 GENE.Transcript_32482~~Transcript_32482.p3  ORF type:complete len:87 (+),score=17.32 Transcript_32482:46-306(+)